MAAPVSRIMAVLLLGLLGCGTAPALSRCALTAVTPLAAQLEREPQNVTPSAVLDAVHALQACKAGADAGAAP
jgi:hypothetical protein